jgi:hypothetical protein
MSEQTAPDQSAGKRSVEPIVQSQVFTPLTNTEFFFAAAVMRGFGVYTLSLSGLLLLATDTLVKPDQETYLKLAPTISIISFYAGFNPQVFGIMLERVNKYMRAEPNPAASKMTATTNTSQISAPAPPSV